MKLATETADVVLGGALDTNTFTIKASAKAFSILSSNLYSNPLGAMIRELSANCFDAHVKAGKANQPFKIKLPNSLEPTFKIRDFGPGLSDTEIRTIYTTFFESTKTDSNDVVGCLGLGSKSPFGVSDNFTINSFYNGTRTVYSAFLNDKRIPCIAKFHSEPTDQPSGLEIEVAIKEEDIGVFAREVNNQLKYFKIKPIVSGNSNFEWHNDDEYLYEGTGWKMIDTKNKYSYAHARVVQGQISYPINTNDMGTAFNVASPAVRNLLQRPVLFEVPIGDVNIAPSREALSYDETTNQNIIKAAEKVIEELPVIIAKAIQDAPTQWEARIKYAKIMSGLGSVYYGRNALADAVTASGQILWKSKDVSETDILFRKEYANKIIEFQKDFRGRFRKMVYYTTNDIYNKFKGKKTDNEKFWTVTARDLENLAVVYATPNDKAVEGRSKQYVNDNLGSNGKVLIIETDRSYQAIKCILGIPTLIKAEDLPKVRREGSKKTSPAGIPVQRFYPSWNKTDQWRTIYVQDNLLDLEGYYIRLERYDAEFEGNMVDITGYWAAAKQMGIIDEKVQLYGLRKINQKRPHNLVDFFEHCKTEIEKMNIMGDIIYDTNHRVAAKLHTHTDKYIKELIDLVDVNSPMIAFLKKVEQYRDNVKRNYDVRQLINLLGFNKSDKKEDVSNITKELEDRYPMIAQLSYDSDVKVVAQYINQMDKLTQYTPEG